MTELAKPVYVNLTTALRKTVSAHQAVYDGIATHSEKHRVQQEARRQKLEMSASLATGGKNGTKGL